jgi:hypothetical protein
LPKCNFIAFADDSSQLGVPRASDPCVDIDPFGDDQTIANVIEVILVMVCVHVAPAGREFCKTRLLLDSIERKRNPLGDLFRIFTDPLVLYAL